MEATVFQHVQVSLAHLTPFFQLKYENKNYHPTSQINSDNPNRIFECTKDAQNDWYHYEYTLFLFLSRVHIQAYSMDTKGRTILGCGSNAIHFPCVSKYL
jgi:hypothetical protein